ncbi:MAG: PKD domain-containing protein [Acidobacteria bacterium]|nr:PKD domain-containing protein [Acidobacteriota bacterium]
MRKYIPATIVVSLNTAVTGLLGTSKGGGVPVNETSAVLIINDNNSHFPTSGSVLPASDTCGITGSSPFFQPDQRYPCPQKGVLLPSRSITWDGVQFPVPGAPNNPAVLPAVNGDGVPICQDIFDQDSTESCFHTTTTLRFTNIVANGAAIGAGGQITATVSVFSVEGISVTPSNTQQVSSVFDGLITDVTGAQGGFQCVEGVRVVDIELTEGFGSAFKPLGAPTIAQGDFTTENGYPLIELADGVSPQPVGGTGGGATQATRFKISFRNVPAGVVLHVPNTVDEDDSELEGCVVDPGGDALCLQRVEGADQDGADGAAGDGVGDYEVPLSAGNGHVIYEVMDGDPFDDQDITVPAAFTCSPGSPTTNLQITATFAPLSNNGSAGGGPVPRFFQVTPTEADLGLEKTVEPSSATPGVSQVVYTLTVTNYGLADATSVVVSDVLPAGLTYVSDDAGCVVVANAISCDVGDLADSASAVINVTASVDADAIGVLTNNAAVTSANAEPAPDPHSNLASADVTVNRDPIANAGPDQTINAPGPGGVDVVLDGSGSSDPDGQPLSYTWTGPFGTTSGVSPMVHIPGGSHSVKLTVEDGVGGIDMDAVTINARTLMVSPAEHTFVRPQGSDPDSKPFFVKALGGTVPYSIARTASWLDSSITSGSSSGESDQIQAIADPGDLAPGSYTGSLVVNGPGVIKEALWAKLIVTAISVPGLLPPDPEENGVVDVADFTPFGEPGHAMAPLSLVIISGTDFVPEGEFSPDSLPLPTSLGGVMVLFDGIPGGLLFVSPTVIIAQLPPGLTPPVAEMIVINGGEKAASTPQPVAIATYSPGIFTLSQDGLGQGIVTFAGGPNLAAPAGTVGDSRPATGGDHLTIWVNGLGPVDPRPQFL